MADVWTSAGVVAANGIVALTRWTRLDAVIGLCRRQYYIDGSATATPPYAAHAAGGSAVVYFLPFSAGMIWSNE
jgi:hypothetical protein